MEWIYYIIEPIYLLAALLFILALRAMSNPATARRGIVWAGFGMLLAVASTVLIPATLPASSTLEMNFVLMAIAVAVGGAIAYYAAIKVQMTNMPQMVAIYNGMGGGAAAGIAAVDLMLGGWPANMYSPLDIVGGLIGSISFAGSLVAFLKLQGWMTQKPVTFPGQNVVNLVILFLAALFGAFFLAQPGFLSGIPVSFLILFFVFGLLYGLFMTLPIGGADMPVVISLYNALTGMAVGIDGFALNNYAMIIAGVIVGAAGSLLTLLMAKAMNRSISNVLFSAFGSKEESGATIQGSMKPTDPDDVAVMLAYAAKVIIAPGYGMAVAQAQGKVKEMTDILEAKGVSVKFGIHPVAGRMPGHMNVLLAEAGVSYDKLFDIDEINPEFATTDVAMVIGANDTVNPAAHRQGSPLFGMPILEVEQAHNVVVLKRGQGKGFAGIENDLFYRDNCKMLYGDAQDSLGKVIQALKKL
ncbi:MAG: NAD(P)(+) transhydrogenase (Re/Si-specific) subunit beta [Candidatus Thermoplasmatota archaeon]|jgi:NAD(P) transhydrogenase subunit beta|nr:NAD(P)(+) transhydrogenase (Re/Si-specific) subunit beta [Candidatus Thermoplasmatota archaeon]